MLLKNISPTFHLFNFLYSSCNVECEDSCPTTSWSEWSTCNPRHCNENYRIQEGGGGSPGGIGYQKPSIPGNQKMCHAA